LRQQQAALGSLTNKQSVNAKLNFFGANSRWRREQRNIDLQVPELLGPDGRKSGIVARCACGATGDCLDEHFFRLHYADASSQARANVKADEYSSSVRENNACRKLRQ
jgi:hypothetical protein